MRQNRDAYLPSILSSQLLQEKGGECRRNYMFKNVEVVGSNPACSARGFAGQ
jgi:hypothetical protein